MKSNLKTELKLKDKSVFTKGTSFEIKVDKASPWTAVLTSPAGRDIKIRSSALYAYFSDFVNPRDEIDYNDFDASVVSSLIGEDVEPDGWDEHGFPSVLLALGMI